MNTTLSLKSADAVCKQILKVGAQKYVVVFCIRSEKKHTRDCYLRSLLFSLSQGQKLNSTNSGVTMAKKRPIS